jgi:membrane protein required for colicin V production
MSNLPFIDWLFIGLIVLMVIHGFVKGLIEELFSWAALILAIWTAILLYQPGGAFIRTKTMESVRVVPELLAFIVIFGIILLTVKILERVFRTIIQGANLGGLNRFLGGIFGIIEGLAFTALIIFVLSVQPLFDASNILGESFFSRLLSPFIQIPLNRGQEIINAARSVILDFLA